MKNIKEYIKKIQVGSIYKIVGVTLLIGIILGSFYTRIIFKTKEKVLDNEVVLTSSIPNKDENYDNYNEQEIEELGVTSNENVNSSVNEIKENNINENSKTISDNEIISTKEVTENKNADEEIIAYMNETESYFSNNNLKESVKERFIIIVDFLFYNGTIKGYTLNALSSKAKLQVLKVALSIDSKIDKYFPDYKEKISSTTGKIYTGIKNKIIEAYLNTTTKICSNDASLCKQAKKDFQDMKKAFSITWNVIKNLVSSGVDNLKSWYEIYSGKVN